MSSQPAEMKQLAALQDATKTIPIVTMADDMLGYGYVNSLARPDGNTTGVSILAGEVDDKRQDILVEAVPGLPTGLASRCVADGRRSAACCAASASPIPSSRRPFPPMKPRKSASTHSAA